MTYSRRYRRSHRGERKERVLHTRVPEVLETELKRLSEALRLPVSNIVRAAIEDVLEAAHAVTRTAEDEAQDIADRFAVLRQRAERYGRGNRGSRYDRDEPDEDYDPDEPGAPGGPEGPNRHDARYEDDKRAPRESYSESESDDRPDRRQIERALRGVIGFQKITLARDTECGLCGREMGAGEAALLAVRDRKGRRLILGAECLPAPEQK